MNNNYQPFHKTQSIVISLLLLAFSCFVLAEEATNNKDQNNSIEHIDFKKGDSGEGSIIVKLSNSSMKPNVVEMHGKIILYFANIKVAESSPIDLEVRDFFTPVQLIQMKTKNNMSTITIESNGNWEYSLYQVNNELIVTIKYLNPITKEDPIFLGFQEISVRDALQIINDHSTLNIIATDSVDGNITLALHNASWEQALDIIMRTKRLATRKEGNLLIIAPADELASSWRERPPQLEHISFKRSDNGNGSILIKWFYRGDITPHVMEKDGKIILDFHNFHAAASFPARLDVKNLATPVQFIDATIQNNTLRITIEPEGNWDYSLYQINNMLVVNVKPLTAEEKKHQLNVKSIYNRETFPLNHQRIEVRSFLHALSDFTQLNLIATDSVSGSISLRLYNVPWEQALDIVMCVKRLAKHQAGNNLIILPAVEQSRAKCEYNFREIDKSLSPLFHELYNDKSLSPLRRELITINYADATGIIKRFQETMAQTKNNTSSESNQINFTMSDTRGSLSVDTRTNTIIANQTDERLEVLRRIVAELDHPAQQVTLDTRIVEVNKDYFNTLKEQINNQQELLDIILNKMQKQGKGKVISQPKITTANKEPAAILRMGAISCVIYYHQKCTDYSKTPSESLYMDVTPTIIQNQQVKLDIEITLTIPKEITGTTDIIKAKTVTKTANNKHFIIIDNLEDFEYEEASKDEDTKLVIFITPIIIPLPQYPLK